MNSDVERAQALKELENSIHDDPSDNIYHGSVLSSDGFHVILSKETVDAIRAALQPPALDAERLERPYGPFYYIENTAKLLRDIDKNGGLQEGGEQYPNGLCCLDNAQRLENGLKEIRLALSAPAWRDVSTAPNDGEEVWVWMLGCEKAFIMKAYGVWWNTPKTKPSPTHWQPLKRPSAPSSEGGT